MTTSYLLGDVLWRGGESGEDGLEVVGVHVLRCVYAETVDAQAL